MRNAKFLQIFLAIAIAGMASQATASPGDHEILDRACTWTEKNGTVLDSAPEGCMEVGRKFDRLSVRLNAAKPPACSSYELEKMFASGSSLSNGIDMFTVVRKCSQYL